ncbi:hypothetical protein Tco_1005530 [Tanacetum coccineum]|uniref:Uncharacterized protein n=1 Tax=Tanacetum coccineum TaxID=301880 RepID=A0ABQ5FFE7_9ASTR
MRADELHKFSDGMLDDVWSALHDIASGIRMEYLSMRKWSNLDKKRARVMVQDIDKQLYQRRLMQNLEKFVGGREYRNDLRLLERTNRRDLPRDIPLDSVVVLRYEKRSKSENKGKVPTEMELVLEQTQQGTSYEVSVSAEGVEELKRKVKIKGEKKEALLTLRQKPDALVIRTASAAAKPFQGDSSEFYLITGSIYTDDEVLKLKNIKKDGYTRFQHQEQYEHVGPEVQRLQEGKRSQDDDKRLCLVDDLKKFKITFMLSQRYKSTPKVKDHYNISQITSILQLLLSVQHKLFHLDGNDIKKLNITKPQNTFPEIEFKEPYTPSYNPPGIVYEDLNKQEIFLRADELYKFSDGTLKSVHDEIHNRVLNFCLDYNKEMPKRKWMAVERKRSSLMVELIDKQLRERDIIRNLERLFGARELEMDYKLMTRNV